MFLNIGLLINYFKKLSEHGYKTILLDASQLTNKYENYLNFQLADGDINIASFLLTWQDKIEIAPKINKLTTKTLRFDIPYEFELEVAAYIGSMIKIDFGDGTTNAFVLIL